MWTDLNMDDSSTLLFVEDAPVLNVSQLIKLVAILVQKSRIFCQMTDLLIICINLPPSFQIMVTAVISLLVTHDF